MNITSDIIIFGGGIILLIIAVIGGGVFGVVKIPELPTLNRLLCATVGVLLIGLGIYLKQPQQQAELQQPICTNYGIKIISPRSGEVIRGQYKVSGTYKKKPDERVQLFLSFGGKDYWYHGIVQFDQLKQTWIGDINITADKNQDAFIMVALVGKDGRILLDYANKVGVETNKWPSLSNLTDDIVECDRVQIITK